MSIVKVGKRVIGELVDNTYTKRVYYSRHLFRKLNAWGIDGDFFMKKLLPTNATIKIFDADHLLWYFTDAKTFHEQGQFYHFKETGRDHQAQIFLPLEKFSKVINPV